VNLRLLHQILTRRKINNAVKRLSKQHTFAIMNLTLLLEDK